jgi:hypothetical protein
VEDLLLKRKEMDQEVRDDTGTASPYNNRFARILLAVTPFAFAKVAPVPLKVSGFHPQPSRLREPHNRALYGR